LTTWFKKSFRRISCTGLIALASLASVLPLSSAADESLDSRYQKAVQLFDAAKMEDACDLFRGIEKESPGYKNTKTYLNPACSSAQQAYTLEEKLFNEGQDFLRGNHLEEAKQKLTQADHLALNHPKYRSQIESALKQIDQLEAGARADSDFQNAVQAFNQGKDDDATRMFTQIEQAKGPKADDARAYLRRISDRQEDAAWSHAVEVFNSGNYSDARSLLSDIVRRNGKHAADAQAYLAKIKGAESEDHAFEDAVKAFQGKRYAEAQTQFQGVVQKGGPHAGEAQSYLQRINAAMKEESSVQEQAKKRLADSGQNPKQVAQQFTSEARTALASGQYVAAVEKLRAAEVLDPANSEIHSLLTQAQEKASEQPLREGLKFYLQGNYDEAEQQLSTYIENSGPKLQLAYFFRGASHASRYFLSGTADASQKDLAFADFQALKKSPQAFKPPTNYVPSKILSLYTQATSAH